MIALNHADVVDAIAAEAGDGLIDQGQIRNDEGDALLTRQGVLDDLAGNRRFAGASRDLQGDATDAIADLVVDQPNSMSI